MSLAFDEKRRIEGGGELLASFPPVQLPLSWVGPAVFVFELMAIVGISVACGFAYHEAVLGTPGDIQLFFASGLATSVYFGIVSASRRNYSIASLTLSGRQVRESAAIWTIVCLCFLGLAFLLKVGPNLSRGATISFFVFGFLFLVVWRWSVAHYLTSAGGTRRFASRHVVVLADAQLDQSASLEELRRCGYRAVKVVTLRKRESQAGIGRALADVIAATREASNIEGVFLLLDWEDASLIKNIVRNLSIIPLPIRLLPDANVARLFKQPMVQVGNLWAAELQRRPLSVAERSLKRLFDIVFAAVGLVVVAPLLAIAAILIKCDSAGPVLFMQTRAGFNHRPFRIFKLRTLTTLDDGVVVRQVRRNDARLTRLGRWLRATSIDELPQLMNVLKGEMSLVGPRPHAAAHNWEYEKLIGNYAFRHHVKPGLTGLAQVNGLRGETTVESMQQRVDCDLRYINNWSFWLDIKLIAKTIVVLIRQPMAY